MPQMTIELYDRRKKMLDLHYAGMADEKIIHVLSEETGRKITAMRTDWYRRKQWEPLIWRLEESGEDAAKHLFIIQLGIERALALSRTADNDNAKVGAIGKLGDLVGLYIELKQSLGQLPRVAERLEVKEEISQVTLNVTDNEDEILSKAAAILNRKTPTRTLH